MFRLLNVKIYRKIPDGIRAPGSPDVAFLYIELGDWWEIYITRRLAEDMYTGFYKDKNLGRGGGFIKYIKAGNIIPSWYGYAYLKFDGDIYVYMPIPLNYLAALWKRWEFWWWEIKHYPRKLTDDRDSYMRGYGDGRLGKYDKYFVE